MARQLRNLYRCISQDHFVIEMGMLGFDFYERVFMCTNCNIYYVYTPGIGKMIFKFKKKCSEVHFLELGEFLTPTGLEPKPFYKFIPK